MLTPENVAKIAQIATALARTPEGAPNADYFARELFAAKGGTIEGLKAVVAAAYNAGRESERLDSR